MRRVPYSAQWIYTPASELPREITEVLIETELKQALLSGISFAVPLIVAGGTVLAVAVLLSQIFGLQDLFNEENSWLWMYRKLGGGLLGILMVGSPRCYGGQAVGSHEDRL